MCTFLVKQMVFFVSSIYLFVEWVLVFYLRQYFNRAQMNKWTHHILGFIIEFLLFLLSFSMNFLNFAYKFMFCVETLGFHP
jgi:hypothetical protein